MKVLPPILLVAVVLAVGAFAVLGWLPGQSSAQNRYQAANLHILDELPQFPSAELVSVEHHAYFNESPPIIANLFPKGWTLLAIYRPPAGTTPEQVLAFFESSAPEGWRVTKYDVQGIDVSTGTPAGVATFMEYIRAGDPAGVSISVGNLAEHGNGTYEINIDQKAQR